MRHLLAIALAFATSSATPPVAEKRPVTDDYHGVKVTDH